MRVSIFLCAGLALLALLASGAGAKTTWDALDHYSFDRYVVEFNKAYASDDEVVSRRAIFESRLAAIKAHNRDASKSWKQGVNQLTDRSEAEIRQLLGYNKGVAAGLAPRGGLQWESAWTGLNEIAQKMRVAAINHVDWREKGVISPVKDQGTIFTVLLELISPLYYTLQMLQFSFITHSRRPVRFVLDVRLVGDSRVLLGAGHRSAAHPVRAAHPRLHP
jgi:hypothetical protein